MTSLILTVYFEDPFWVGVFEHCTPRGSQYARIVFGGEPTDQQILEVVRTRFSSLEFTMFCGPSKKALLPGNPKRRQRLAAALVKSRGPETKSQAAFKKDYESRKLTAAKEWSKSKLEKEEKLFQMKREKRKKKHKGR